MVLAGLVLSGLFREHVQRQFELALTQQLDQLTTRLDFDAAGHPVIDTQALSDPRWQKPYSGLYWQIDQMAPDGHGRAGVLRSRSLWDTSLALQADALERQYIVPLLTADPATLADADAEFVKRYREGRRPGKQG